MLLWGQWLFRQEKKRNCKSRCSESIGRVCRGGKERVLHKHCCWQLVKYTKENELFLRSGIFLTFMHGSLHDVYFDLTVQTNSAASIIAIGSEIKGSKRNLLYLAGKWNGLTFCNRQCLLQYFRCVIFCMCVGGVFCLFVCLNKKQWSLWTVI